jgi:DNA-directed RNA polymerase specialized sigma24 family protein
MSQGIDELQEQLYLLAKKAQQHPPLSVERQIALTRLIESIMQSGKLSHPQRSQFSANVYEEIYSEAIQELLLYICKNIHKYDPQRGSVMTWVNVLLELRFFKEAAQKKIGKGLIVKKTLLDLDNLATPQQPEDLTEILRECIELDSENLFKQEHIENHPQANFQALAMRRISGKYWKEIAAEFDIKITTISSFYYRCLKKFSPNLKDYCSNVN